LSIFIYVGFAVFYALRDAKKAERKWDVDQLSKKFV
jgi:hypothetical protein